MKLKRFFVFIIWTVGAILAFIFTVNASVYAISKPHIHKNMADLREAQVALIPGAAIFSNGSLSPIFKDRVDGAVAIYQAGLVSKILVSGDNSTVYYNEVSPVRNYLLDKGIPDEDIFLDHAGFDTYSTMYRAKEIFQVKSLIISTQSFHQPRSVFIARSLGMNASGFSADTGQVRFKNYVREVLANEKAFLNLIAGREPKYLGEPIPIDGDSRNYP